ncbi:MAG: acetyl-CoA carboxylase biotin carboxylase subunit [Myxococcales bacterium]|nr:acetyl-CoA carboxylase biotin carboxylase subunit [Myxococcales bacterium]
MFKKILIANRGEIALRIIRACRELQIPTVAVHSEVDENALHVRFADESVCIGPASPALSYLNIPAIIAAAEITGADAIHPGYGFLSENSEFATVCGDCGLTFIGPTPENMQQWGDKIQARQLAERLGLPLSKGSGLLRDVQDAVAQAKAIGYPVMLKAAGGGGGRGMQIVRSNENMLRVFASARAEALAGFRNGDLYCERFVEEPRHIEFQVVCDTQRNVRVLGERECTIQRRHQKLLEEAPSVAVSAELRNDMASTISRAMRESGYVSLGTLEFLMDEKGSLSFMEMNTRVQVEHPVTELITGVDLVTEQILIAAGQVTSIPDGLLSPRGHAIECRINAEDPQTFAPSPGLIHEYHPPGGAGIRVDSGVYGGWRVPSHYDSLLFKVIAHSRNRTDAIARMRRALSETIVSGIRTNVRLHQFILQNPDFVSGKFSTRFIDQCGLSSIAALNIDFPLHS